MNRDLLGKIGASLAGRAPLSKLATDALKEGGGS